PGCHVLSLTTRTRRPLTMNIHDLIASWSEMVKHAPDRRGALKLLGAGLLGGALTQLVEEDAGAACQKRNRRCSKRKRCCKGLVCKRGKCQKRPKRRKQRGGKGKCKANQQRCSGVCVNLNTDPNNCGVCGKRCLGGTCSEGFCFDSFGSFGDGQGQ